MKKHLRIQSQDQIIHDAAKSLIQAYSSPIPHRFLILFDSLVLDFLFLFLAVGFYGGGEGLYVHAQLVQRIIPNYSALGVGRISYILAALHLYHEEHFLINTWDLCAHALLLKEIEHAQWGADKTREEKRGEERRRQEERRGEEKRMDEPCHFAVL